MELSARFEPSGDHRTEGREKIRGRKGGFAWVPLVMWCDWSFSWAASFCQAHCFLCDWTCKRRTTREAVIQQRSHASSKRSEHKVASILFCSPVPSTSAFDYILGLNLLFPTAVYPYVIRFFCRICCRSNERMLHLNQCETWADLRNTAGFPVKALRLFYFYSQFYSAFIFSFSLRMCLPLQVAIATIIYTGHCWNANLTSPLQWEIILTSPAIAIPS